ncbi:MAG: tyrosine-type recombinase/integrase [Terricaulis sp.]
MHNNSGVQFGKRRGETWSYRREVPPDVRPAVGLREWSKGLGRISKSAARIACAHLAAEHDTIIERVRAGEAPLDVRAVETEARLLLAGDAEERSAVLSAYRDDAMKRALIAYGGNFPAMALSYQTTEEVLEAFGSAHGKALHNAARNNGRVIPDRVTIREVHRRDVELYGKGRDERPGEAGLESFVASAGNLDVRDIRKEDVVGWINACRRRGLKDSTIRRRAEPLSAMVRRWFKDHDLVRVNPFSELGLSAGSATDRVPFNRDHLAAIDAHLVSGRVPARMAQTIRVLKGTGAGPSEICGLERADVMLDAEVPHIWIRPNGIRRLKTKSRERRVPLVGDALEAMRAAMEAPVDGGVFYNAKTFDITTPSTKINATLRAAGIPKSPRLSAYSFRHGVKQALVQANAREDLTRYLMGHAGSDIHHRYGAPAPLLREARDAMTAAMIELGNVDASIYQAEEIIARP